MGIGNKYTYNPNKYGWEEKYGSDYVQSRPLTIEEEELLFQAADEEAKVYHEPAETNPPRFSLQQPVQSQPEPQSQLEPKSGQTPPPAISGVVDPFANTRAAMSEQHRSWRQMLIDSHKKREAERSKRLRSEQIVGIGKALGDLLGAAFAGAGSLKGNYEAIVPQPQAPKSVERIHSLINEGIVNAKDYDKMMLNIALQKGKNDIALAQAIDEMNIKAQAAKAQRAWDEAQADKKWAREKEATKNAQAWQAEQAKLQREYEKEKLLLQQKFAAAEAKKDRVAAAARAAMSRPQGPSAADKAILGRVVPQTVTKLNQYGIPETVQNKPSDNELSQYLYREYNNMRDAGLDPNKEEDKQWWADNYQAISSYIAKGHTYSDVKKIVSL